MSKVETFRLLLGYRWRCGKMFSMTIEEEHSYEIPIIGMDCAECTRHVQRALLDVPGVDQVQVYLASEKAVLSSGQPTLDMEAVKKAVVAAGYAIAEETETPSKSLPEAGLAGRVGRLTAALFALILLVVVAGEWLGLFDILMELVPPILGIAAVLLAGFPIFKKVVQAARQRRVIAHTLMSIGVLAALIAGQWITALLVVFFMRVGDAIEGYTAEQARQALRELTRMAPQTATVVRDGLEINLPVGEVVSGDIVIIRPGEKIPVDGLVIDGQATLDQATITGESMPVDVGPGATVFAATFTHMGSLRVQVSASGADTTFGKILKLVEEAEANRGEVQRLADKFTQYYLPVVGLIAFLTLLISGDPMATVAVLVVACSCAIALATPIAMLASIGQAAKKGILIKGGKYIELLDQADVLLIDKTGTLTLGRPQISQIMPTNGLEENELLVLAASAEKYSEHPLAEAVRSAAIGRRLDLMEPLHFESMAGLGLRAEVDGRLVTVGNKRMIKSVIVQDTSGLSEDGGTMIYVAVGDSLAGILVATDTLRSEVPEALQQIREMGISKLELITGDNRRSAAALAMALDLPYRAELLPEDKIAIVKEYQDRGHKVVMVGDGVNDAPALAQADVGVAMGVAGSDVALEAAHVSLLRDDWQLIPELFRITRRTMGVVRLNLGFTGVYNIVGLALAAVGILPPVLAAAAQSLPDLGILANSSRLLKD